jgi:radical SAM protein with 4Fe4S-binding SPASM domain
MESSRVHLDMAAVHFSTRCGAACSFCYFSDPLAQHLQPTPIERIREILVKLAKEEVSEVLFVGGDPVVHPQFIESLEIAKAEGLTTYVLSNSWSVRPKDKLAYALGLIDFCEATILGSAPTSHDRQTQRPGSFDTLVNNLEEVARFGKAIGVCANATPENLHEIYDIVRYISVDRRIPVRSLMIQRIVPSGAASGKFKFGLNLEDVDSLMRQIDRAHRDFGVQILFEDPVPWCTVDPQFHKYLAKCEWGYTRGAVSSTGALNRCGADDHYRLGTIWDANVQDTWENHPILRSFRSKKYLPDECLSCDLLSRCGGGCPLSCGTLKDHDLDQLYIQRKEAAATGLYNKAAPGGKGFDRIVVRFAYSGDLEKIVALEDQIFGDSSPIFTTENIREYFNRCPQAFRVAVRGDEVLGYLVIAPLNDKGLDLMETTPQRSIVEMPPDALSKTFGIALRALYLEVIAIRADSRPSVRIALLKDLVRTSRSFRVPTFTCPVSEPGVALVGRAGFVPITADRQQQVFVLR